MCRKGQTCNAIACSSAEDGMMMQDLIMCHAQMLTHAIQSQAIEGVTETNLASLSRVHGDSSIGEQVFQLYRFAQVCVPHHAAVLDAHILEGRHTLINLLAAILQCLLSPEHCCIILQQSKNCPDQSPDDCCAPLCFFLQFSGTIPQSLRLWDDYLGALACADAHL